MTNPLCNRFADPFYGYDVKVIITPKKKQKEKRSAVKKKLKK